jgi:hypothetical protein
MVSGRLQAFNGGTPEVEGKTNFTHVGRGEKIQIDTLKKQQGSRLSSEDQRRLDIFKSMLIARGEAPEVDQYHSLGFDFSEDFNIKMASKEANGGISYAQFEEEWNRRGPAKWLSSGIDPSEAVDFDNAMKARVREISNGLIVNDDVVLDAFNTVPENIQKSSTYKKAKFLKDNISQWGAKKGLTRTIDGVQSNLEEAMKIKGGLLNKDIEIINGDDYLVYDSKGNASVDVDGKLPPNKHYIVTRTDSKGKKVLSSVWVTDQEGKPPLSLNRLNKRFDIVKEGRTPSELAALRGVEADFEKNGGNKLPVEKFGKKIGDNPGNSFSPADQDGKRKPISGVGGFYEKIGPDGKKIRVFAKPMVSYAAALAEMRGTEIAREVHGLESPEQRLITMEDPKTNAKFFGLESPMEKKFTSAKMDGKFSKENYFTQLVAASLRGDKDVSQSNMSGNRLTDVGPAGVFGKASGNVSYATAMPSMEESAIALFADKSGARKDFGKSTRNLIEKMTPEQYKKAIIDEIDRVTPKLQQKIADMNLPDADKEVYNKMLARLRAGRNADWEKIHALHTGNFAFVTEDEVFQDKKTGKTKKIPGEKKPKGAKPSSGKLKDSKVTIVPDDQDVRKPIPRTMLGRVGRGFTLPSNADAPFVNPYSGLSDDEAKIQKSLRRQAFKLEKEKNIALKKEVAAAKDPVNKSIRRQAEKLERDRLYALRQEEKLQRDVLRGKQESIKAEQKRTVDENRRAATRQNAMVRMQGMGMAAGMASTAGYMTGNTGIGNALMGVSVLAMLGPMLATPVGAAALALTATAAPLIA